MRGWVGTLVAVVGWSLFLSRQSLSVSVVLGPDSADFSVVGWGNKPSSFRIHDQPEQVGIPPISQGSVQIGSIAWFLSVP